MKKDTLEAIAKALSTGLKNPRSIRIPPWLTGILVAFGVTFIAGFYFPLKRANEELTEQFTRISDEYKLAIDGYQSTNSILRSVQKVSTERKSALGEITDAESAAEEALTELHDEMEVALETQIKNKIVALKKGEGSVRVTLESMYLIYPHKTFVHAPGTRLLCQITEAIPEETAHPTQVLAHANSSTPSSLILRRQFPTSWQLSALMASEVAEKMATCGLAGAQIRAVGAAHFKGDPKKARKSAARFEIFVYPKPKS